MILQFAILNFISGMASKIEPTSNAIIPLLEGPVAQLVEQRIENPRVDGSIPSQATNPNPSISNVARVFCFRAPWLAKPIEALNNYQHNLTCKLNIY